MASLDNNPGKKQPDLTVVLVSYNTAHLLDRLFESIEAARGPLSLQIIVVDNASRDGSAALVRARYPDVELIENKDNVGFGRANNQALAGARARYLLFLNTDAFVSPYTFEKTVAFMEANPRCGVLGTKLVSSDGSLQPSCRYFPTPWNLFAVSNRVGLWLNRTVVRAPLINEAKQDVSEPQQCDWVTGCYYLVRKEVIDQVGLFDPRYFLYYEEVDHCRRVRAVGWQVVYFPGTQVVHLAGESASAEADRTINREIPESMIESKLLYLRKYHGLGGLLGAVLLDSLGSAIQALGNLARLDLKGAAVALRQTAAQFRLLVATRFATKPTR